MVIESLLKQPKQTDTRDVFVSWSGGKDCCLSLYRAMKQGLNVRYLTSIVTEDTGRIWPHMMRPEVIEAQAEAIGIPFIKWWTTVPEYEERYKEMLSMLKEKGITGGVFGDVSIGNDLAERHRKWVDSVCRPLGVDYYLPLWNEDRETMLNDLIDKGFKAVIIAADEINLGSDWLGLELDNKLLAELKNRHDNSPDGEVGAYHTLVVDGPVFKKRVEITKSDKVLYRGIWYLDIRECRLLDKRLDNSQVIKEMAYQR